MSAWTNIALAAKLTSGPRQAELRALLAHRGQVTGEAQVVVASPRRFLSLRKLLRPNAAINDMLQVIRTSFDTCAERGISYALASSDKPSFGHVPQLVLSHHTVSTPAFESLRASGSEVLHFKAADLPRRTCFDRLGFAGWASLADKHVRELAMPEVCPAQINYFFDTAQSMALSQNLSKYAQTSTPMELPEKYVFVALQTIGDMVQRNAYIPMLDMLDMVVKRFAGSGYHVVVKRHPKCRSRRVSAALANLGSKPDVLVVEGSIHQIIADASAVFTVNSGVGAESIVHEVPLYCFGKADYAPIAHQVRSGEDLARLTDPISPAVSADDLRKFLYYYRNVYQVRLEDELPKRLAALIETATV